MLTLGVLAAVAAVGVVFFIAALLLLPVIYLYQRYRMNNFWADIHAAKKQAEQQAAQQSDFAEIANSDKVIDGDYKVINEEEKK